MRKQAGVFVLLAAGLATPPLAQADLAIEQTVDAEVLTPGAVVEFVVTVRNTGEAAVETGEVNVGFSPGLAEPAGTAPFFSQGSYDPAVGRWAVGSLPPGASAVLALPAQVTADLLPPCVFSQALLESSEGDPDWAGEVVFASLRRADVEHCVDLVVEPPSQFQRFCTAEVRLGLRIWNLGPDPAHQVRVSVTQQPDVLPGLAFEGPCSSDLECTLDVLGPASFTLLWLRSTDFNNAQPAEVTVTAAVSSSGVEFASGHETASAMLTISPFSPCDIDVGPIDLGLKDTAYCFVATAAYGSALHPHVKALRRFRDRFLLTHAPGRALVAVYYHASPRLAHYIAARPVARGVTRALLWPLVLAVEHPMHAAGTLLLGLLLVRGRRRARRRACPRETASDSDS
jgi:uncharacterized repeat protein (TIGR01451 family)